ncbi:hypothetical protein KGF56_003103 [Candida oxycetoniae]|uniref:Uncharacterized protein n=1 Tax=Candida oxycetoniae TaxID=497107 RepID=A0AAI9SW55_9ASCO|nr:uncharacterized protein KGF56_003103 [Candida oxycetoniae]KAI3404067.2 hypothetical protein KGF56_003103 [Candida oxycetoniae]
MSKTSLPLTGKKLVKVKFVKKSGVKKKIDTKLIVIYCGIVLYGVAVIVIHIIAQLESSFQMSSLTNFASPVTKKLAPKEVISFLSQFTPCDVSDSLNECGIANGGFIPNLVNYSPVTKSTSVVGKAYTVLYAPKSDPRPAVKQSYIDNVPEDAIVVIGLPLALQTINAPYVKVNNALYGGLMSTRAKYRKANGSVILGRIRDLDEHNDLKYPVWSYGVGTSAPGPLVKVVGINVPLEVKVTNSDPSMTEEILTIFPGDYLIADKNGVVKLKDDNQLSKILDYIPKRVDADTKVSEDIKKGKPAAESQKHWRGKI